MVCVTYTGFYLNGYMTGYNLGSTASAWPHQENFTLPGHLFRPGFSRLSVRVILSVIFISGFVVFMDFIVFN